MFEIPEYLSDKYDILSGSNQLCAFSEVSKIYTPPAVLV